MLSLRHRGARLCDGVTRREWLRVGALGSTGLTLDAFLRHRAAQAESGTVPHARAAACIRIFLWGGPGAQETWDIRPDAPDGTRGDFRAIATSVPGIAYGEHLPMLAARAHRYAVIRSLAHDGTNHGTSSYHMLTGHVHPNPGTLRHPTRNDVPNLGCNAARFLAHPAHLPAHVHLPAIVNDGDDLPVPGQGAGLLGDRHEPFEVLGDPNAEDFQVPALSLAEELSSPRLERRAVLQRALDARLEHLDRSPLGRTVDSAYERAFRLLGSPATADAFALSREPARLRDAYGRHWFGQSLLLARRLVEAGVPIVSVYWTPPRRFPNTDPEHWDTHSDQHARLKDHVLPPFDRGLAALLDDLHDRGLLDRTLVTWWGEFGRTPKINSLGGRDHWGFCQSVGLAGGGIAGGRVHGSSTRDGGYPAADPVRPDDLSATVLHLLGIDPHGTLRDLGNRPLPFSHGEPVAAILA